MQNTLEYYARYYILDKILTHHYIAGYTSLFEGIRDKVQNVLEIGIGSVENNQMMHVSPLGYRTGNSLRCWRDYFPNATIYGIDIYEHNLQENRIITYKANQYDGDDLIRVATNINSPIDIIIDDGSHVLAHQAYSFMTLEKYMSPTGIYVIEDVQPPNIESFKNLSVFPEEFKRYMLEKYNIYYFDTRHVTGKPDDFMMVFTRK